MDAAKANALHSYYEECQTEDEGSWYLACAAADAADAGCSDEELAAVKAIADLERERLKDGH